MIARIWHGTTKVEKADEYLQFLNETGIPHYRGTPGNLGAFVLRQIQNDTAHFLTLSFWQSLAGIKAFAGDDYARAHYYPDDKEFLLEFEPTVQHYELFTEENSAMNEKEQIVDELQKIYDGDAWHADNLMTILSNISAERALAKPISRAHSIWEIALHITSWNKTWAERLAGNELSEPVDGDFPAIPDTGEKAWQETLERLKASHYRLIEVIKSLDQNDFSNPFGNRDYTLSSFLHGIVRHLVYHSGQIALLKKA